MRPQQQAPFAADRRLRVRPSNFSLADPSPPFCHAVQHVEADIMPRVLVLPPKLPKPTISFMQPGRTGLEQTDSRDPLH